MQWCVAALLLNSTSIYADGGPVLEPVPITGAYTARQVDDREHVSVIEFSGNYDSDLAGGSSNIEPRAVIAREFYRTHPDDYDFLVAFSTFEFNTGEATALHWGVQNSVQGIGLPQYDNTDFFGSNGKLQGFIDMAALTRYNTDPLNPDFEKGLSILAHEMLHQWGSHVRFKDTDGNLSDALLGRDGAHWSFLLNSDASVEYGNLWKDNGDGTFTSTGSRTFYSPLDLYLMGFYKPEEVPPFFLIDNPDIDKTRLPKQNVTINGTKRWVSVDDVIAAEGARVPSAENAQKNFRMGFILLTAPGESVTDAQIAALNNVRNAYMTRFAILTGGRGVAEIYPEAVPDTTTGEPGTVTGGELRTDSTDIGAALAWLRDQQQAEGEWFDKNTTDVRDTTLTLEALTKLDPDFNNGASALSWLEQNPSSNTDYLARYAIALNEIGSDASALRPQLVERQNSDGGFGLAPGYQSDPLDTALVLLALSGAGADSDSIPVHNTVQYLYGVQNSDGGFSPADGGPSRTSVTTTVIRALKSVEQHSTVATAALAFLSGKQNPDGGFGDSPSTVHDTANVMQTLMALDTLDQIDADAAANYLISRQTVSGSWDGSVYSTAKAVMALKQFKYPNWAITSVTADPVTVKDGDKIELSIHVRNDSHETAPQGVLRIYDGDPSQGIEAGDSDITIPPMAGGTEMVFTYLWDSFDKAGSHTLYAIADPDKTQTEMSERDNLGSVSVTVDPPAEAVDLTFGSPGFSYFPAKPNRIPTTMSISLNVRNLGLTDAENAKVVLWDGEPGSGTLVGEKTINVLNRSSVVANFSYELNRSGRVVLTAEVDPDNAIDEESEINNTLSQVIEIEPSVDLVVHDSDISIDNNPAIVGSDVTFKVNIANEGTSETPDTDVRYYVTDGTTTKEVLANSLHLAAGESIEQTVTWRVDLSGDLTFTAELDPDGLVPELDDTNNQASLDFSAGSPSGANLAVSYQDFTFTPSPGLENESVVLTTLVRNTGTETVNNAEVAFYNGDPTDDNTYLGSQVISTLAAGENTEVSFTWESIPTSGDKLLYAVADPDNTITEFSEEDNSAFNVLPVLSLPDLALSTDDIQLNPQYPKAGDSITISIRVANFGDQQVEDVPVLVYDGDPETGGVLLDETSITQIAGHDSDDAEVTWNPGDAKLHNMVVLVDPDDTITEQSKDNNTASREVLIQDENLSVTQKYFSPNGDGVKDSTQLLFTAQGEGEFEVHVINEHDKVVRHFTVPVNKGETGASITWNGLDDLERLVEDGTYRLRVIDPNNSSASSEVVVYLDTNRSSLLEAAGTKFESYNNLTCDQNYVKGFSITNDDSSAFFVVPYAMSDEPYEKGIYRMQGDGTDVQPIIPSTWEKFGWHNSPTNMTASGDGSRIVFTVNTSPMSYWVADGDGKHISRLNYSAPEGTSITSWHINENGSTVYLFEYNSDTEQSRLISIPQGGVGIPQTLLTQAGMPHVPGMKDVSGVEKEPNDYSYVYTHHNTYSDYRYYISRPKNPQKLEPHNGSATVKGVIGNLTDDPQYDVDYYSFEATEGDQVTIKIKDGIGGAKSIYTAAVLLKPGGNLYGCCYGAYVARSLWSHTDPHIDSWTVRESGTHVIAVISDIDWNRIYYHDGAIYSDEITYRPFHNGDYTLEVSGLSGTAGADDATPASHAFTPDDSSVAFLSEDTNKNSILHIVDTASGAAVTPYIDGNEISDIQDMEWSPNSKKLVISRSTDNQIVVFDKNGNLVNTFNLSDYYDVTDGLTIDNLTWSSNGYEFAFKAYAEAHGAIYIADTVTGSINRVASFRDSEEEEGLDSTGSLLWVPADRSLLYRDTVQNIDTAIFLDENNRQEQIFTEWAGEMDNFEFTPTQRQALFTTAREAKDPRSACYLKGRSDNVGYKSLLNLTAELRALRSAKVGGVILKGTAADLNFDKYRLDYALADEPDNWRPVTPPAGEMVLDDLYSTWIPPQPGNYLVRLTADDLAGNVRQKIKQVSWSDNPSITDVSLTPKIISPNGDGEHDNAFLKYRVLEPVHLTFEIFDETGKRIKTISRDHGSFGIDAELRWDGRDQYGSVVSDGRYRITVQKYEFFVTVDNTPPDTNIEIRDAYQPHEVTNSDGVTSRIVSVAPGIIWKAEDVNLYAKIIEKGIGNEPLEWSEQTLGDSCTTFETQDDDLNCNSLSLDALAGNTFRIEALDDAGNRSVSVSDLVKEELIINKFGNHENISCESTSVSADCDDKNDYLRLESVPYVSMGDTSGGTQVRHVNLSPVRFNLSETIAKSVTQLYVQYRPVEESDWHEANLEQYMKTTDSGVDYETLSSIDSPVDHQFSAVWDMHSVEGGKPYVLRLRAVDASGKEFYSNTFRFFADGLIFLGTKPSSIPTDVQIRLLNEKAPSPEEHLLWGKEFVTEPLEDVSLIISSKDDPNYATEQVVDVAHNPDTAMLYGVKELQTCKTYTGYLEATTVPVFDSDTGTTVSRTIQSAKVKFTMPCLGIEYKTEVVPLDTCGAPSNNETVIRLAPISGDGAELKLLTLSQALPDNSGEDVLYNVNNPAAATVNSSGKLIYNYTYTLNTASYPEGYVNLTATLINVNDDEIAVSVPVLVDHTPPVANLTYPVEGQRLCGLPVEQPDGSISNTLTFEGEVSDAGGVDYSLSLGEGDSPTSFTEFHNSRSLDSFKTSPVIDPPNTAYRLKSVAGPIGQIENINGEFTVLLQASDTGGFKRCDTRTFHFDGLVEGASANIDRRLFSPNNDERYDEVTLTYAADEEVNVDIDLYHATSDGHGKYSLVGDAIRRLKSQSGLLGGEYQLTWNGLDNSGNVVTDGWYGLSVTFTDSCGNSKTVNTFTEVDQTSPNVSIAYPNSTDPLPLMVEMQGSVSDMHLKSYTVEVGAENDSRSWAQIATGTANTEDVEKLATWNTYGLVGGYVIRLEAVDTVGNTKTVEVPVNLVDRVDLISYLETVPNIFSPNSDGKLETTGIRFGLEQNGSVSVFITDAADNVKRTIYDEELLSTGAVSLGWDGKDDSGNLLPDGEYAVNLVVISSENPLLRQDEHVSVVIDKTAPEITVSRPANEFISTNGNIVGTIQDANIAEYNVSVSSDTNAPNWLTLESGNNNHINSVIGNVDDQDEGDYLLKVEAKDLGETGSSKIVPFTIDRTPPKAAITSPQEDSIFSNRNSPIDISGSLEESDLLSYELSIGEGDAPISWNSLESGNTLTSPELSHTWDLSALNDGIYTLRLSGKDKAGNVGESRVSIAVDNTDPAVSIKFPADGAFITEPLNIIASVNDINLDTYVLEISPGGIEEANRWNKLKTGTAPSNDELLYNWEILPPDGVYTLRLTATDAADNAVTVFNQISIDTNPPTAPKDLVANSDGGAGANLSWNQSADNNLSGYIIYRDGTALNSDLIVGTNYYDTGLVEGRYTYTVKAVDRAGLESEFSNEAVVVMDVTPPTTRIITPASDSTVSGMLDIKGTAYSDNDFKEYRLYVGNGLSPSDYQLLVRSPVPVLADLLAQWNTLLLQEGAEFTLKLEAVDINGNVGVDTVSVKIDNESPAAPTGLTATTNGSDVSLNWNINSESDLLGYLLFRNDRLANLDGILVGSTKPYALLNTDYTDKSLSDGNFSYYLLAIDQAGNLSEPSNAVEVDIDTRTPQVNIVQPEDGTIFDKPIYVLGSSPDTDIATVTFQYRLSGTSDWVTLGVPDTNLPYETTFDPASLGLDYGEYQLRGVAEDLAGHIDQYPTSISLNYKDVTPPAPVTGLTTTVDGGDITLNWSANQESDLAGYNIYRVGTKSSNPFFPVNTPVLVTGPPVTENSYTDTGLDDDIYTYTVVAVDTTGNNADPSTEETAIVYTPTLEPSYTVTTNNYITISGSGASQAVGTGNIVRDTGDVSIESFNTDSEGYFTTTLSLSLGTNKTAIRLTDAEGNVSKPASANLIYAQPPSKPNGLVADVTGYDVALNWDANPEDNVLGYRVFRDGMPLFTDSPVVGLTATTSFMPWNYGGDPAYAVDGDDSTHIDYFVSSNSDSLELLDVQLPEAKFIKSVNIIWNSESTSAAAFDVQAWLGNSWVTVAKISGNDASQNMVDIVGNIRTDKLRLILNEIDGFQITSINELEVNAEIIEPTTSYTDNASDGAYSYTVSAVNEYGLESEQSDPADASVGDVTPPDALTLTSAVNGSDVTLSWLASNAPDVAKYVVYRDGDKIATLNDTSSTEYVDYGLENGNYSYVVKVIDNKDNESAPSNEVVANVAVTLPPVPINLAVTYLPEGGSLNLEWEPGDTHIVTDYKVYRSSTESGPYQQIDTVSEASYLDTGLVNGNVYYYVVTAVDEFGNSSDYSNEASGVPADQVAPAASITYPAISGNTYDTDNSVTNIVGITEAGASVSIYRNGWLTGTVGGSVTDSIKTANIELSNYQTSMSPDGRYAAVHRSGEIALYDFVTGTELPVTVHHYSDDPVMNWSRNGQQLLFVDYDETAQDNVVRAYNPSEQSIETIIDASQFTHIKGAIASSNDKIFAILAEKDAIYGLWRYESATHNATLLSQIDRSTYEIDVSTIRWSPNAQKVAYVVYSPSLTGQSKIEIADVATGSLRQLEPTAIKIKPSWSSDSELVLFTAEYNGVEQVWRYSLADNLTQVMTEGPDSHSGPVWLPDDSGFTCIKNNSDVLLYTDSGSVNVVYQGLGLNGRYIDWVDAEFLALRTASGLTRIAPAGRFELHGVDLEPGENVFTAIAQDAAGNSGTPSMPVVINFNPGDLPDLSVEDNDLRVLPSPIVIGDTARISATVHNDGALTSPNAQLSLMAISENGVGHVLLDNISIASISPKGATTLSADWVPESAGTYHIVATVDAANDVFESDESNNVGMRDVMVAGEAAPSVQLALDQSSVGSDNTLTGSVTLGNSGESITGILNISIEDEQGYIVQNLSSQQVSVTFGDQQNYQFNWGSGSTFAGIYRARAQLVDSHGALLAQDSQSFTLNSSSDFSVSVTTDQSSYGANDDVVIAGNAIYQSGNTVITGGLLNLTLVDANGTVVASKEKVLGDMLPGMKNSLAMTWNTGLVVGEYTAQLKLEDDNTVLASSQIPISVESTGPVMRGSLSLSDSTPAPGTPQDASFRLENVGNTAASDLTTMFVLIDGDGHNIKTETFTFDVAPGGNIEDSVRFDTTGLPLQNYQILLQSQVDDASGTFKTLARASFELVDRMPPVIAINSPGDNAFASGDSRVVVYARDQHSGIQKVEIRIDGGVWLNAPVYNSSQSLYSSTLQQMEEGSHVLEARAFDQYGNSTLATPVTFNVDNTPPVITVAGVSNGGLYNYDVSAEVSISDANLSEESVSLNGVSYTGEIVSEEGVYELLAQARDLADNFTQKTLSFEIDKTAPLITIDGVDDGGLYREPVTPVITISDKNLSSQSVKLNNESFVSGSYITEDGQYTLSVSADDGATNSATATVSFEIDQTPPDAPVITYPGAGDTVNDRVIDITGASEPNATLYLVYNNTETAVYADSNGGFVFPQVTLENGNNSISVYAKDRAGNIGSATTVNFYVITAELTGAVHSPSGVLVLIPGQNENTNSQLQTLIESTLGENDADYLVVHDEMSFLTALRTSRYAKVLMADLHPTCEEHGNGNCGNNSSQLNLSLSTEKELRAYIAAGTALIWIKPDSDASEHFSDILGAKSQGMLPSPSSLMLDASPASEDGNWDLSGVALNVEPVGGIAVGKVLPYGSPALVLNSYGNGPVALVTFDPSRVNDSQDAKMVIDNLLDYAVPINRVLTPGGLAEVSFYADKLWSPISVHFGETAGQQLKLIEAFGGTIPSESYAEWTRELSTSQTTFSSLVRLPQSPGRYYVNGELSEINGNALALLNNYDLEINVTVEEDELLASAVDMVSDLEIEQQYETRRQKALELLQQASAMPRGDQNEVQEAVSILLDAVWKLRAIPNSEDSISAIGQLIQSYRLNN